MYNMLFLTGGQNHIKFILTIMEKAEASHFERKFSNSKLRRWEACTSGLMSDCTFLVRRKPLTNEDGEVEEQNDVWIRFTCHKMILATASEVFERMLYGEFCETVIRIEDVTSDVFTHFLRYIYTYELDVPSVTMQQCLHLFAMGNKYMMQDLIDECVKILCGRDIWITTVILPIFKAACLYENLPLLLTCYKKIQNNFTHILRHDTLFDLTLLELKRLVVFLSQNIHCNLFGLLEALESYGNYHNLRCVSSQSVNYADFLELKNIASILNFQKRSSIKPSSYLYL